MKKKLPFLLLSGLFLILFYFFTFIVRKELLVNFDFNTTVRLQNHIPQRFDGFLSYLSLIGSVEITTPILILALIFIKLPNKKTLDKKDKLVNFVKHNVLKLSVLSIFLGSHIIELIGKTFMQHPGPSFGFFRYNGPFNFPSAYVQPGSSYPSGHSLRIIFLAVFFTFLIYKSKKHLYFKFISAILLYGFTFLMLISRISLGEHWTTDVIGGSILGLSSALLSLIFLI